MFDVSGTNHSMLLGWLDDSVQYQQDDGNVYKDIGDLYKCTGAVVLHEFGHALGMIHEHQSTFENTLFWNTKPGGVYDGAYTVRFDENGNAVKNVWPKELVDAQIINRATLELNGSRYDPESIMHYFIPESWLDKEEYERRGLEMPKMKYNTKLSRLDKIWLSKYYRKTPFPEDASEEMIENILKNARISSNINMSNINMSEFTIPENVKSFQEANKIHRHQKQRLLAEERRLREEAVHLREKEEKIKEHQEMTIKQSNEIQKQLELMNQHLQHTQETQHALSLTENELKKKKPSKTKKIDDTGIILSSYHQDVMLMMVIGAIVCGSIYFKAEMLYKK
jgi:hypothetical protein